MFLFYAKELINLRKKEAKGPNLRKKKVEQTNLANLIGIQKQQLPELDKIRLKLKKRHKNCAVSTTVGSSASILGSTLLLAGIFGGPVSAAVAGGCLATGVFSTIAGVGTTTGTTVVKTLLHRRTRKKLETLLQDQLKKQIRKFPSRQAELKIILLLKSRN